MPVLYLMIGAPASGKTTVALHIRTATTAFLICPDLIREHFHWSNGTIFDYAYHRLTMALQRGQHVILDATSAEQEHRLRAIAFGHHHSAHVIGVWCDASLSVCLQRHLHRVQNASQSTLTPDIIRRYHDQLATHPPTLAEGYDRLVRITLEDNPLEMLNLIPPPTI